MIVLDLCSGIGGGAEALAQLDIRVLKHYASEIDPYALAVSQTQHPEITQLGDLKNWKDWNLPKIDLLIAGFPCQAWSLAGKSKGLNDPRGELVLDVLAILEAYKPKYFLFENVKMKKTHIAYINSLFGVQAIELNSRLFSAQNRVRLYWTNIPQPVYKDTGVYIKDIIEGGDYIYGAAMRGRRDPLTGLNKQRIEIRQDNTKTNCITTVGKDSILTKLSHGKYDHDEVFYRHLSNIERERLQTYPDNYTVGVPESKRLKLLGNSFNINTVAKLLSELK